MARGVQNKVLEATADLHNNLQNHDRTRQARRGRDSEQRDVVLWAHMKHGVAVADGCGADQAGSGGDAVTIEVGRDLEVISAGIEVGDRVVAGMIPGEYKRVR